MKTYSVSYWGILTLDLLKFESHPGSNDFLNTLVSSYFQPQILQPPRITDHSAAIIDVIYQTRETVFHRDI